MHLDVCSRERDKELHIGSVSILILVAAVTMWMALDGKHYWHDIRFLYASTQFSIGELLSGFFNPHQLGGDIDQVSTGGFYFAKIFHLYLLKSLFTWIPPYRGGMTIAVLLSLLCVGLSVLISYQVFLKLFKSKHLSLFSVLAFMLMPVTPYLGGKIISEITAVLLITISMWIMMFSLEGQEARRIYSSAVCGIFLLLAALARLDIIISFFGLWAALLLFAEGAKERINILKKGGMASGIFIIGYLAMIYAFGMEVEALIKYFKSFTTAGAKPGLMSLLGILTFGGIIYVFAIIAIFSHRRREALFFFTWLMFTAVPVIAITKNYMVEPRYLSPAILPLAGLGSIGIDMLWGKTKEMGFNAVWIGVTIIIIISVHTTLLQLMPYELDRPSLLQAVDDIMEKEKEAIIMVPWAYTDYHFLHVMLPERPIYNVQSLSDEKISDHLYQEWLGRLQKWYGDGYIDTSEKLDRVWKQRPLFYLGWRKYPPVENARKITTLFGLQKLESIIDSFPLRDHLVQSWMWNSNEYVFGTEQGSGQYRYYKVDRNK